MKTLYKIIRSAAIVALVAGLTFYYKNNLNSAWVNLQARISPCDQPIAYSIGDFDKRFGLSREDFLKAIDLAAQIWDKGANKILFKYSAAAALKINLIYDARQDSTVKLKKLGLDIGKNNLSYETLKAEYTASGKIYKARKLEIDGAVNNYNQRLVNYKNEVKAVNRRGGATPDEAAIIEQKKRDLNNLASSIKAKQDAINRNVDELNALANVINRLIYELNLNVSHYNTIGAGTPGEFQEGAYESDNAGVRINIYQFDNQEFLVRVLAHELGHALGLEHLDNPQAIMYKLNEGGSDKITAADSAELKKVCKIK